MEMLDNTHYSMRALRRHHRGRLKKKRHKYASNVGRNSVHIETPCRCSCWLCGNQRKHHGTTVQERKYVITRHNVYE